MAGRGLHRRKSTFYRGEVSPGGARHRLYRGAMACLPEGSEISRLGLAFLVARRAVSKACPASAGQELTTKTNGRAQRFGFITSNSLRQVFCRRVVAAAMEGPAPLHLVYAIPDHPWTDGT